MIIVPESYILSRDRFRSRAGILTDCWQEIHLTSLSLPSAPELSTDIIAAAPLAAKDRLIVITTGEHGIEGYLGAAVLDLFIEEYAPQLDAQTTGLLLIHAINPWGMHNWERQNSANVDLNRNFINGDFTPLKDTNPDYPALSAYFSPHKQLNNLAASRLRFVFSTLKNFAAFGPRRIREAALMGQYRFPQGIYFGGTEIQPETAALMDVYRQGFAGYREIIHLDMHTGYGPRDQMTLVTSPHEKMPAAQISARFGTPRVAAANPDEFYTMQGDMIDWEYQLVKKEFPDTKFFAAACEFGTYGNSLLQAARSLRITILKNRLNQQGGSEQAKDWVEREFRELYLPSDPAWLEKALADARKTFDAVVQEK
jgi:hypothetical protein